MPVLQHSTGIQKNRMNMRIRLYLKNVVRWFRRWFETPDDPSMELAMIKLRSWDGLLKNANQDNPSTELALIKLLSEQTELFRVLASRISHLEHNTQHRHEILMTALETLTSSVNGNSQGQSSLTTAVNAAIVQLGKPSPTDAQLLSLAAAIDQSTASDAALTVALNNATSPVVDPAA